MEEKDNSVSFYFQDKTYVMYIKMENDKDYTTWLQLAKPKVREQQLKAHSNQRLCCTLSVMDNVG